MPWRVHQIPLGVGCAGWGKNRTVIPEGQLATPASDGWDCIFRISIDARGNMARYGINRPGCCRSNGSGSNNLKVDGDPVTSGLSRWPRRIGGHCDAVGAVGLFVDIAIGPFRPGIGSECVSSCPP